MYVAVVRRLIASPSHSVDSERKPVNPTGKGSSDTYQSAACHARSRGRNGLPLRSLARCDRVISYDVANALPCAWPVGRCVGALLRNRSWRAYARSGDAE